MQSLGANARQAADDGPMTAPKAAIPEAALATGGTEKWNSHYLSGLDPGTTSRPCEVIGDLKH